MEDKFLSSILKEESPQGGGTQPIQVLSPATQNHWTCNLSINPRVENISPDDLRIHFNQSENVSSELCSEFIAGKEVDFTCSDYKEISKACMTSTSEKDFSDEQNLCLSPDNDTEKYSDTECSAEFEGTDLEPIHNKSGLMNLNIKVRDSETCLDDLKIIHIICQNPPEEDFSNQPGSQFIAGQVSYTKEECVHDLLRQLKPSSHTQGCLFKKIPSLKKVEYTEDKQLTLNKSLYQGAFGKVDLCQDNVTGYEFIRKKVPLAKFRPSEVFFPLTIKHENIMKICGVIQRVEMDGENIMEILMDNAGMSLAAFVMSRPEKEILSQALIWDVMKQALMGLSMLHSKGIIHLDIKPENLCVQEDNMGCLVLTITDFGSAMTVGQEMDFVGWTPEYMAPESCRCYLQQQHALFKGMFSGMNNQITGKVDIFSLGLTALFLHEKKHVLLNLLTEGQNSYSGLLLEKKKVLQLQLLLYLASQENPVRHLISDDCSIDMRDVLSRMLSGSADMRPTAEEALAYMTARVQEVKQTRHQPVAPKPDVITPKKRNRHNPSNKQFKTEKGRLVTQPSCSSSEYMPRMTEVSVCQLTLPTTIYSLPENEPGPIKDHMLKQKLRERLIPYPKQNSGFQ